MATVDTLNIEITTNANAAADSIRNLTRALNNLNKNLNDTKLDNISKQFASLNSALGNISSTNLLKLSKLTSTLEKYAKVKNAVGNITGAGVSNVPSVPTMPTDTGVVPDPGITVPVDSGAISETATATEQLGKKSREAGDGVKKLNKTLKDAKSSLKTFRDRLGKIVTMLPKFVRALGRIAFYRTVRMMFKGIADAIKEGTNNLVLYSQALNNTDSARANETMSRFATSILYIKNSIGAAVMPILNILIPAFERLADVLVNLINIVNQFFAVLLGRSTFTKAKKYWVDYGSTLDKTTGKAKALNKQLANFDELNNLTTNDNGGSGNGDLGLNPVEMFEEATVKMNPFFEFITKVREVLLPSVQRIYETLKKTWTEIQPSLQRIKDNLTEIWQNVLEPIIVSFIGGFGEGFADRFEGIGEAIVGIVDYVADLSDKWAEWSKKVKDNGITDSLSKISDKTGAVVQGFMFGGALSGAGLKTIFDNMKEKIDLVKAALDLLDKEGFKGVLEKGKDKLTKLSDLFVDKFGSSTSAVDICKEALDRLKDATAPLKTLWDNFTESVDLSSIALGGLLEIIKQIVEAIRDWSNGLRDSKILDFLFGARTSAASIATGNVGNQSNYSGGNGWASNIVTKAVASVNTTLQVIGDPNGMFKVMQKESANYTKKTGHNAFGY